MFNLAMIVLFQQIQAIIKIAKTNFVVMKLVVGGHKEDSLVRQYAMCMLIRLLYSVIKLFSQNVICKSGMR